MLILTRRPKERLRIGESIVITVLRLRGNQVRIGIEAPRHIAVDREEIHARKSCVERTGGSCDGRGGPRSDAVA